MIPVFVENDPALPWNIEESIAKDIVNLVITGEKFHIDNITLIFGSDSLLSELKKEYFGLNQLTDVIAFRLNPYEEVEVEGEIYISPMRAKENSDKFKVPFSKEIGRLIIHGCLHLLNYDDQKPNEKKIMRKKENLYLKQSPWEKVIDEK